MLAGVATCTQSRWLGPNSYSLKNDINNLFDENAGTRYTYVLYAILGMIRHYLISSRNEFKFLSTSTMLLFFYSRNVPSVLQHLAMFKCSIVHTVLGMNPWTYISNDKHRKINRRGRGSSNPQKWRFVSLTPLDFSLDQRLENFATKPLRKETKLEYWKRELIFLKSITK